MDYKDQYDVDDYRYDCLQVSSFPWTVENTYRLRMALFESLYEARHRAANKMFYFP